MIRFPLVGLLVAGCLAAAPASAGPLQGFEPTPPSPGLLGSGLLNMSRFDISHSLTYGVSSSSLGTQSGGVWLTQVGYRVSSPLRLSAEVGALIDPGNGWMNENSFFLHQLALDYQPSRSFQLHVSYVNVPSQAEHVFGLQPGGLGWTGRSRDALGLGR